MTREKYYAGRLAGATKFFRPDESSRQPTGGTNKMLAQAFWLWYPVPARWTARWKSATIPPATALSRRDKLDLQPSPGTGDLGIDPHPGGTSKLRVTGNVGGLRA